MAIPSGAKRGRGASSTSLSRRDFLQRVLVAGGSLVALPACGRGGIPGGEDWKPAYRRLEERGLLAGRIEQAGALLEACSICPRDCGVDRTRGQIGYCRAPGPAVVFSHQAHYGEELPLVGRGGSGTIFFSHCNLRCVFCQNWPIAHEGRGRQVSDEDLASRMLALQRRGCHNINLVTPTHYMPQILRAVRLALHQGLRVPLVYNTGGYERVEMIRLLDGIVDIYLPDVKFMDQDEAGRYTGGARDYPEHARAAVLEMHRQVGGLQTDADGVALRGVMIRHLVMPDGVAGTRAFITWLAESLPRDTYVNIMAQYRVEHEAFQYPRIARAITPEEFLEAIDWAEQAGLTRLDERAVAQRDRRLRRL